MRSCTKNSRAQHYCINTKPEEIIYQKAPKKEQPSFEDRLRGALIPTGTEVDKLFEPFLWFLPKAPELMAGQGTGFVRVLAGYILGKVIF